VENLARKCRNLEYIDVSDCPAVDDVTLTTIAEHCSGLRYLCINGSDYITTSGLVRIATKCTNLKAVYLPFFPADLPEVDVPSLKKMFPHISGLELWGGVI
jgi:hypothetical protein